MRKIMFVLMCAVLATACVTESGNTPKQYQFGEYVFTQQIPGVSMYTCAIDSIDEAYELFDIMTEDYMNSVNDVSKSKFYQKYGIVMHPLFLVKPFAKTSSGKYMYKDYEQYHIECSIETREEYEASKAEFDKKQSQAKNRVESFL